MGRKGGKKKGGSPADGTQRRGMRRSIRYEAEENWDDRPDPRNDPDRPPEILLRMLKLEAALARLETQIRAHAGQGHKRVLVVHGKGSRSPGGVSVLGPEVRNWCDAHPGLVVSWEEAPARWGGGGAVVVTLR